MSTGATCTIDNCDLPVLNRGWCSIHYGRWYRHGNPLAGRTMVGEPLKFLIAVASKRGVEQCVIWPYHRNEKGRAKVHFEGKQQQAHRIVCEIVNGPCPAPGIETAHNCGNGHLGCVNPDHLRWATHVDNMADRSIHGTILCGEDHKRSKLTVEKVTVIRSLAGQITYKQIGAKFGISSTTVGKICRFEAWRHIE